MTIAEQLRDEGRREGHREGRREGRREGQAEGERTILLKQLALKFGALDPSVQARVAAASLEKLERWAERILTAERLEAVLEET